MSQWCAPGHVLCCLCFGCFSPDGLWTDEAGQKWDMCLACGQREHAENHSKELRRVADGEAFEQTT